MDGDAVWVASGSDSIKYLRGKEVWILGWCQLPQADYEKFQVGRLNNPFGTSLGSISVFGSQLLALTEDGSRMLVWETNGGGKHLFDFFLSICFDLNFPHRSSVHHPIWSRIYRNSRFASCDLPEQSPRLQRTRRNPTLEYTNAVSSKDHYLKMTY